MAIFRTALDAIYRSPIAANATFTGVVGSLRVIDKTTGIDSPSGPRVAAKVKVPTVRPLVLVRDHEVAAKGLTPAQLVGKWVEFNGVRWYVHAHEPHARPDGYGETALYVRANK